MIRDISLRRNYDELNLLKGDKFLIALDLLLTELIDEKDKKDKKDKGEKL